MAARNAEHRGRGWQKSDRRRIHGREGVLP